MFFCGEHLLSPLRSAWYLPKPPMTKHLPLPRDKHSNNRVLNCILIRKDKGFYAVSRCNSLLTVVFYLKRPTTTVPVQFQNGLSQVLCRKYFFSDSTRLPLYLDIADRFKNTFENGLNCSISAKSKALRHFTCIRLSNCYPLITAKGLQRFWLVPILWFISSIGLFNLWTTGTWNLLHTNWGQFTILIFLSTYKYKF